MLRAVGDNHASAHALGYPVLRIRALAVLFGGACAGLGGAYLPLAYTPFFVPGHDGRTRLDRARAGGVRLVAAVPADRIGAYLFGAVTILQLHAQATGARHSVAADVVAALSRDHHRAGRDLADARHGRVGRRRPRWALAFVPDR